MRADCMKISIAGHHVQTFHEGVLVKVTERKVNFRMSLRRGRVQIKLGTSHVTANP